MRGEFRKCDDVTAERRVKGLVKEDMVVYFIYLFIFFGGLWGCELLGGVKGFHGKWRRYKKNRR